MQVPDGTQAAQASDELYREAPAGFIAARGERARQARAAGDADLARAIAKLRRPTVSAWLVNQLARDFPGDVADVLELGGALREAQRALAGDRLRELSERRRQLISTLIQHARQVAAGAGVAVTAQAEREVSETLDAALGDEDAARALASGMLTRPLSRVGLGDDDAGAAIAFPPGQRETVQAAGRPVPQRRAAQAAEQRRLGEAEKAERVLGDAREIASQAQRGLDDAEQRLAGVRDRLQAAQQRTTELERLHSEALAEQAAIAREVRDAQRIRDTAARWLHQAHLRLTRAEDRAASAGETG